MEFKDFAKELLLNVIKDNIDLDEGIDIFDALEVWLDLHEIPCDKCPFASTCPQTFMCCAPFLRKNLKNP